MESLLRPLVTASGHTNEFKNQFLQKVFLNMDPASLSASDVDSLLKLFVEWILTGSKELGETYLVRHGHAQLKRFSNERPEVFREFVSPHLMIDIFTNNQYSNKAETVVLTGEIIDLLHAGGDDDNFAKTALKCFTILNIARSHLSNMVRDHAVHLQVASALGSLFNRRPELLPSSSEARNRMAMTVIQILAGYRTPPVIDEDFLAQTESFSRILGLVWNETTTKGGEGTSECLHSFYEIISSGDSYSRPSCALLCAIDKIPEPLLDSALRVMVETKPSEKYDEGRTVTALQTMIEWLTQRSSVLLSDRLVEMLQRLHESNRNSVLIEIAHASAEKLLQSLPVSKLQRSTRPIFFYLLLGFQHSETLFHQIASSLPDVIKQLRKSAVVQSLKQSSAAVSDSRRILEQLSEAVYFLVETFPGFPELYDGVLKCLRKSAVPPPTERRIAELKLLSWISKPTTNDDRNDCLRPSSSSQRQKWTSQRSETGLVGLINLGNTCYMNSVIQALFVTSSFCDLVLAAAPPSQQTVLPKLQLAFAFLRNTMRSIYSPADLLRVAAPPWFEFGRQQDCSEFLRYLLDTLHEQEKRKAGGGNDAAVTATTAASHRVCLSRKPACSSEDVDGEELAKVRPSFSTTALDSISEHPEHEERYNEDLYRQQDSCLSSGCGEGVKGFGSRTSLSTGRPGGTNPESDSEEEEGETDVLGSRGSLSGGSLCRWTTEENLSFGGSREDKIDLVDGGSGLLHDCYSTSTDSGIQSVGDSIRGSSDSMTNKDGKETVIDASANATTLSIVEKVFGGKLQTTYVCSNCNNASSRKENFTDLNLAVPKELAGEALTTQQLLDSYLLPESLSGDNRYRCDNCHGLQDAVKRTEILEGPSHLMCTLMRFRYDREANRKSKVCTEIDYGLSLNVPTGGAEEKYSLYAIVVHSGYSSDGGHYYTYAHVDHAWHVFNDSKVSFSTFDSFVNLSKVFPVDTAYILFYRKSGSGETDPPGPDAPLRMDLKMAVERDNIKFMRERENVASTSSSSGPSSYRGRKDGDEDEGGGGGGGSSSSQPHPGGCGGNAAAFNSAGRFIC